MEKHQPGGSADHPCKPPSRINRQHKIAWDAAIDQAIEEAKRPPWVSDLLMM